MKNMIRIVATIGVLAWAGSAQAQPRPQTDYSVGPQDVLTIQIFGEPELSGKYTVEQDGTFTFPQIGRIKAAGLTLRALEQEQTMRSLQEAEARFRSLVERNPVVTYTQATDDSGTFVYVSPQLESLTGYRPEEWTEQPEAMREAIHAEDRDRVLAVRRQAVIRQR